MFQFLAMLHQEHVFSECLTDPEVRPCTADITTGSYFQGLNTTQASKLILIKHHKTAVLRRINKVVLTYLIFTKVIQI
jgi:hypothetical protein